MTKVSFKAASIVFGVALVMSLGVSSAQAEHTPSHQTKEISDPIEPVNRFIFGLNDVLDHIIFEPLAKGYKALLPKPVRNSVQNFMRNLASPLIIANSLLQGKFGDAGVATTRFVMNSTIGIGGLVDVAGAQGMTYKSEDFGQTLATWGVGNGPYVVLPILGPSSLRDTAGLAVDSYADPVRIVADNTDHMWAYYTKEAVEGLDNRSRLIEAIDDMRRNSLDYYAAARSAYTQKRASLIRDEDPSANALNNAVNSTDHP